MRISTPVHQLASPLQSHHSFLKGVIETQLELVSVFTFHLYMWAVHIHHHQSTAIQALHAVLCQHGAPLQINVH